MTPQKQSETKTNEYIKNGNSGKFLNQPPQSLRSLRNLRSLRCLACGGGNVFRVHLEENLHQRPVLLQRHSDRLVPSEYWHFF